jgi:hypothetical protein
MRQPQVARLAGVTLMVSSIDDAERIDVALYAAIAETPTLALDREMARHSRAADHSRLSMASAALLATAGGRRAITRFRRCAPVPRRFR